MNHEPGHNLVFFSTVKNNKSLFLVLQSIFKKCVGAIFDNIVPQIVFAATVRAFTMKQDETSK